MRVGQREDAFRRDRCDRAACRRSSKCDTVIESEEERNRRGGPRERDEPSRDGLTEAPSDQRREGDKRRCDDELEESRLETGQRLIRRRPAHALQSLDVFHLAEATIAVGDRAE